MHHISVVPRYNIEERVFSNFILSIKFCVRIVVTGLPKTVSGTKDCLAIFEHMSRSGRPSTASTDENRQQSFNN